MKKSKISLMLVLMLVLVTVSNSVFAAITSSIVDTSKVGSLTITALGQNNQPTENLDQGTPLKGVKYALYRVDEVAGTSVTTLDEAEAYIVGKTPDEKVTDENGKVSYTGLVLGRYYAKVVEIPTGTTTVPVPFLVDIPMTNEAGTGWVYDISVSPKVQTATGDVVLTKEDLAGNKLKNATFKVQVNTSDDLAEDAWVDYLKEGETTGEVITVDETTGQINLANLPITYNGEKATYRVVEMSAPDEEYFLDNAELDLIVVNADGTVTITNVRENTQTTTNGTDRVGAITVVNEKPTVTVKVGENKNVISANATDVVPMTITADVPVYVDHMTTYTIENVLPEGLDYNGDITVTGILRTEKDGETSEEIPADAYTTTDDFKLVFDPEKLTDYATIVVTYNVKLDMDNAVIGSEGNTVTATVTYANNVDTTGKEVSTTTTTDSATVLTGGVLINKVDAANAPLAGATFKIARSENDAINGVFVKDDNGNDVTATSIADGSAEFNGLAYTYDEEATDEDDNVSDYWIVEVEAPTFIDEDGAEKHYTLLSAPEKVAVSGTSHTVPVKVINRKPFNLPLTGGMGTILFLLAGIVLLVIGKSIRKERVQD